jgi:hypothetical protein
VTVLVRRAAAGVSEPFRTSARRMILQAPAPPTTSPCLGRCACVLNPRCPPTLWRGVRPCLGCWEAGSPCIQPCDRYARPRASPSRVQSISVNSCLLFAATKLPTISATLPRRSQPPISSGRRRCRGRPEHSAASVGLPDYPQVDMLGSWYKSVTFGVERSPVSPKW